jgi:hypothetical protein
MLVFISDSLASSETNAASRNALSPWIGLCLSFAFRKTSCSFLDNQQPRCVSDNLIGDDRRWELVQSGVMNRPKLLS